MTNTSAGAVQLPAQRSDRPPLGVVELALLSAPVLMFVGYALHPDLPNDVAGAVSGVAGARGLNLGAKLLVALGGLLMAPLLIILRRRLAGTRGAGLATVGVVLAVVGTVSNAVSQATTGYLFWYATAPGVSREAGIAVVDASTTTELATLPVSFLSMPLFALGLLLLTVALWLGRTVPAWAPALLLVGNLAAGVVQVGPAMLLIGAVTTVGLAASLRTQAVAA